MPDGHPVRRWAGVRCEECGREDDSDGRGWRGYLADAGGGGEEVLVYCPHCAEKEFGD
jgi:hypothetical protein